MIRYEKNEKNDLAAGVPVPVFWRNAWKEYRSRGGKRRTSSSQKSITDHSRYLKTARNGSRLRYRGLKGCRNYKKAFRIIKNGGYATDPKYVSKLCKVVETYHLTQYDKM